MQKLLSGIALFVLVIQLPAVFVLLSRLLKGRFRQPPIQARGSPPSSLGKVSVVVPTLNEAQRISPLLTGLSKQSDEVQEVIVVDSNSEDGTRDLVRATIEKDPRFRLITDNPLPADWVGRPWALHHGFLTIDPTSEWLLGMDADTQPAPGLVAGLIEAASRENYDLVSLSPQFILKYPGESWLQPALLMTLLYRFVPVGVEARTSERVMANGQCFLCRRSVLEAIDGYTSAKGSFCDDVTLARKIAASGFKVGFLDGAKVLKVRMYEGAAETWREWGRSLDLKDASSCVQLGSDLWLLASVQGLPLPIVLSLLFVFPSFSLTLPFILLSVNVFLLSTRFLMLPAIAASYDFTQTRGGWLFWLSPIADPLAVLRIFLSAFRTPKQWRGRKYG